MVCNGNGDSDYCDPNWVPFANMDQVKNEHFLMWLEA